jgi:6-phosphofructokinase 2
MTIVTVTLNPAIDVCTAVPWIEPERKLHCTDADMSPGGGGVNVARAVRRLGGVATAVFPWGGTTGALLCELLQDEGIPLLPVRASGMTREDFAVTELTTGRQYRFILPGPTLSADELDGCVRAMLGAVTPGSIVVLSGSLPAGVEPSHLAATASMARQRGARVVVDTSGPALGEAAQDGVFLLKPSVNELRGHAGHDLTTEVEIADAAQQLLQLGPTDAVLVSLAAHGALLVRTGMPPARICAPAVRAVSAIGAGDSLVGGLVLALERGNDLLEAARHGVAAGTATAISSGHALCRQADVDRLLPEVYTRSLTDLAAVKDRVQSIVAGGTG